MVSSFKFSNHIVLCHLARPNESIPLLRSSQCHAPPLHTHINRSHCLDLVSVLRAHSSPPQINSITPIQSHAPMARPHNSIPSPTSSQCRTRMGCPHKSIPSPRSSRAPPWCVPINQYHRPVPASVAHPHKSIPPPRSSQCCEPPSIKPIAPIQPGSRAPMARAPMARLYESIPSPQSSQCHIAPWRAPMNQSHRPDPASVAYPQESIPYPWFSQCRAPPWRNPTNQCHHPDPVVHPHEASP